MHRPATMRQLNISSQDSNTQNNHSSNVSRQLQDQITLTTCSGSPMKVASPLHAHWVRIKDFWKLKPATPNYEQKCFCPADRPFCFSATIVTRYEKYRQSITKIYKINFFCEDFPLWPKALQESWPNLFNSPQECKTSQFMSIKTLGRGNHLSKSRGEKKPPQRWMQSWKVRSENIYCHTIV